MRTFIRILACCSALAAAAPGHATSDFSMLPVTVNYAGSGVYHFSHIGWTGGGMVTGTFTAFDDDNDGQISSWANEVSNFSFSFSGNVGTPAFNLDNHDFDGLIYTLDGSGLLGDNPMELPIHSAEGIWVFGSPGVYMVGPNVLNACNNTVNCAIITAQVGPEPFVGPEAAPEPTSWAMMIAGFGLIGAAMRRRHRYRAA